MDSGILTRCAILSQSVGIHTKTIAYPTPIIASKIPCDSLPLFRGGVGCRDRFIPWKMDCIVSPVVGVPSQSMASGNSHGIRVRCAISYGHGVGYSFRAFLDIFGAATEDAKHRE